MWLDEAAGGDGDNEGQGFDANNTTIAQTGSSAKSEQTSRRVVPFFIKHMQLMSEELQFFGQTIQMVEFYGVLRSQVVSTVKIIYEIEDFSDKIVCVLWLDHEPDELPNVPNIMLNSYCRVVGSLKSLSEGRRVMVLKIESMKNPNELVTFMLSAICARYEIEKLAKLAGGGDTCRNNNATVDMDYDPNNVIGNPFQYKVYKAVQRFSQEDHGGVLAQIMQVIKSPQKELMDALEFLVNEGHIYTTIDDDHFKVAL